MSNHGALTPIYYGKFPDSENSKNRLRGTPLSLGASHPYPGGLQLICCFRVQGSDPPKASKFRDGEGAIRPNQATNCTGSACPTIGPRWKSRFFLCATMLNSKFPMATSAKKPETSFETAMERLEKIVEEMESGKMLLEDLLVRYEEGMKLVKVCQDRLAHAEQKIQVITRDHAGKTSVKDFAAAEPPIASSAADSMEEKDNDDVRLF